MSNYKHGIRTSRRATQLAIPITSDGCLQCVIGTAPVNLAADPYDTVHKPFVFHNKAAAIAGLGYCTDFEHYTLCQSMYATFDVLKLLNPSSELFNSPDVTPNLCSNDGILSGYLSQ